MTLSPVSFKTWQRIEITKQLHFLVLALWPSINLEICKAVMYLPILKFSMQSVRDILTVRGSFTFGVTVRGAFVQRAVSSVPTVEVPSAALNCLLSL